MNDTVKRLIAKRIGSISSFFTEAPETFTEATELTKIKKVTRKDVVSKYFMDWFFKMDDWADITPEEFPFYMITNSDGINVYGYFNGDKLDAIIRVGDLVNDEYELSFFFVNKALQHQGIGQRLFKAMIDKFADKDLILYVYTDNYPAVHIYKKYGFKQVRVEYGRGYKPSAPHYVMRKECKKGVGTISDNKTTEKSLFERVVFGEYNKK